MSWTYSGNPSSSALDETRFLIGDTDSDAQLLSNDEITYLLTRNGGDPLSAAISGVRGLIAAGSKEKKQSRKVGDLTIADTGDSRVTAWESLLAQLLAEQARLGGGAALMVAAPSQFTLGQMDNSS